MKEINLKLKVEDVNLLLSALGNLPFIQVHELIGRIQSIATEQLNTGPVNEKLKIQNGELEKSNSNSN